MYDFGSARVVNRPAALPAVAKEGAWGTGRTIPMPPRRQPSRPEPRVQQDAEPAPSPLAATQFVMGLVTQLIATKLGLPQTRTRRRAAPREAVVAYDEMVQTARRPQSFGRRISIIA